MRYTRREGGATLIVALIMLILLTLLALTSANLGKGSLQAVGNMQQRNEAYSAAQETIEQAISTTFYETPSTPISDKCGGANNTKCVDTNGDGVTDVTVTLDAAACVTAKPYIPSNLADNQEVTCAEEQDQTRLGMETKTTTSACWETIWELRAKAKDDVTGASVEMTQGVSVPVQESKVPSSCISS